MKYSDLTRRYFESASRAGTVEAAFRGAAGHPSQGIWVQYDLVVEAAVIADAYFLAFACPHTIAVAAWLAEQSIGRPLQREMPQSVAALRELFAVPVEKLGRLLIVEDAWRAAVGAAIDFATHAPNLKDA
jgi:NifU-like protein involved in Fe-S cluster formation